MLIDNGTFRIEFRHSVQMPLARAVTECVLLDAQGLILSRGKAVFDPSEPWSRAKGGKKALALALRHFPKIFRSYIWSNYWKIRQKPGQPSAAALQRQIKELKQSRDQLTKSVVEFLPKLLQVRAVVLQLSRENALLRSRQEKGLAIAS